MKITLKSMLPILLIWLLLISEALMYKITILKYSDEAVTIFFICYLFYRLIFKKGNIDKSDALILLLIVLLTAIGLISNILSGVQKSKMAILIDIIANFKTFICFIGFKALLTNNGVKLTLRSLVLPAKLLLIAGTAFSIVSLFFDIGMRGEYRFGLYSFAFVYKYAHLYAITILICLIIIRADEAHKKSFNIYFILAISQMILTTKGPSLVWVPMAVLLLLYYKRYKRLNVLMLVVLGCLALILGRYQISTYFLTSSAPRALLYKYGIITANRFFPLGSGFATYGSDASGTYYSSLYYLYGFDEIRGFMPSDTQFLNDNFWPKILGQFGWPGLIIMLAVFFIIFRRFNNIKINWKIKAIIMSAFLYMCIHSLGSSSMCTSASVTLFVTIALVLKHMENKAFCLSESKSKSASYRLIRT